MTDIITEDSITDKDINTDEDIVTDGDVVTNNTPDMEKMKAPQGPISHVVQSMLNLIQNFSDVITKETDALKQSDFKTVDSVQVQKKSLADQYQIQVMALQARQEDLKSIDLNLKELFIQKRTAFTKLLVDNMTALENMKSSTQRLADNIISSARETVENQPNYAASGYKTQITRPVSIRIDENF